MIPIATSVETREIPAAVIGLIIANLLVFLIQTSLAPGLAEDFIYQNGLVPARYTNPGLVDQFGLAPTNFFPFFTNSFMHAGWLHLLVNMWTLWLFGKPLEERLGTPRFVLVYLLSGLAASIAHFLFNLASPVPAVGASGAIAGLLGGYTLLYPRARVMLLTPVLFFPVVYRLPAMIYTGLWLVFQLVPGIADLFVRDQLGGIAWWAHIGGLAAGAVLVKFIGAPKRHPREIGPGRSVIPTDTNRPWLLDKKFMERHRHEMLAAVSRPRLAPDEPRPETDWEDEDEKPWDQSDAVEGPWDRPEDEGPWGQRPRGS